MATLAQKAVGRKDITVLADKGYYSRSDIKTVLDSGAVALVPKGDTSGAERKGLYNRSMFRYNRKKMFMYAQWAMSSRIDLPQQRTDWSNSCTFNNIACRDCSQRSRCTTSKRDPRRIRRWVHEAEMEEMHARLESFPQAVVMRKQTVEHPFGTIKMWMGATHFLMRKFKNVSTEISLHILAYNRKGCYRYGVLQD